LSAAISANAFVSILVNESKPLVAQEAESVREDVKVIGNSLQYINDLLRSMLDSHRAQSQQILIEMRHVDIRNDVFKYVASILYRRGCTYEIIIDCPEELVVMSDPLRLKQIILNLALNSAKFVDRGFLRMGASVNDGMICLYVDDSGPGIPVEKRHHLFAKFQQSLDTLHQGTGIGLSLCKQLIELMGGEISLDESYESGIEACPGARFLIALNTPPHQWEATQDEFDVSIHTEDETSSGTAASESCSLPPTVVQTAPDLHDLPENLSVLFVDDDFILRKLFIRSVKRYRPNWTLFESASGEAALQLVEERGQEGMFDLIFMDQYMASTQKQLLGTETIRLLRSKGVTSILCGLSANNLGSQFKDAGADCFMLKPLPCETNELARTLHRVLHSREQAEESSGS
jgi:CheY-like chemotaxis protein